ncbi:MAG: hypothetical protein AMJ69_03720 [Gammaproteobacteria bacterium SG8_47]|nr:MAG: hypothetical protein AMJ69_03720 [Gammaproteobacteria bacterium SG8_47]
MTNSSSSQQGVGVDPSTLSFVAPCRTLEASAPLRWLRLGWADLTRAPRQSLTYGGVITLLAYLIGVFVWQYGTMGLVIGILSGFIFLGPALAIGLYSISCQLQIGRTPQLGYCLREGRRHMGNEALFAVILLVIFLLWARAASMVHVFFPMHSNPDWSELAVFLGIGTAVGSVFAALIFAASAFSLPMIMDRKVDMITAVLTSANAVLRNRTPMAIWAALIVACVALCLVTGLLGVAVLLPLLGHATWHAYKDTIVAESWPTHEPIDAQA